MKKEKSALSQGKKVETVYGFYKRVVNTLVRVPAPKELKMDSIKEKGLVVLYGDGALMMDKMTIRKANRHKLIVTLASEKEKKKSNSASIGKKRENNNGSLGRLLTQSEHQKQFFYQEFRWAKEFGLDWEIVACSRSAILGPTAPLRHL